MRLLRLEVGAPAHGGHCVARHDGRVVFVRHALPGEVVTAQVTEGAEGDRYWRADAVEVHEASPDRVGPAWPEAGPGGVGGGELSHVSLPAQRDWKLAVLREAFERFARQPYEGSVLPAPGDEERAGLRYRTRVEATADAAGRAAMRRPRSHDSVRLRAMPLTTEAAEHVLLTWNFPEGAAVRIVDPGGRGEVSVWVDGQSWKSGRPDQRPNAAAAVTELVTVGQREFRYRVAGTGFWQVHRQAPSVLVGEVLQKVGQASRALDLYSGAGLFTLPLADDGREVVSVESDPIAVANARRSLHATSGAVLVEGDVRDTLRAISEGEGPPGPFDAAVLDPPRSGAGEATLQALAALGVTRIVYVACDPVALARDTALLAGHGYALVEAQAWDLFPMTHHVETVAAFDLR